MVSFVFCSFAFKIVNENEMKRKFYIFGVLAALCLLGTGYYAWTLYDAHRKQVAEWNEGAKAAFEEALWMEVNKRAEIPFYSSSSGEHGMTTLNARIPDSVSVMTVEGFRMYKIDKEKYEQSLIKETRKRARLSTLFFEYPLSVDSLSMHWNNLLKVKEIPVQSNIRYVYTDLDLQNDTIFGKANHYFLRDSLTVSYLGFRCEHELVAFVSYPHWLLNLSWDAYVWLIAPWIFLVLLVVFYTPIEHFSRSKFVKEKIVEKEVHVADVEIEKAKTFRLQDGTLFDTFSGTLTKEGLSKQLPPQSVLLLKLFLRKENHHLSPSEIDQELWKGQGTTDQLHKAIQRLRIDLKKVSSEVVVKSVNGNYELKQPISSKNLEKKTADED